MKRRVNNFINLIQKMFKQRTETLKNGTTVKEGDMVMFVNSDKEECKREIERRKDGSLFFWNNNYAISDYHNAVKL